MAVTQALLTSGNSNTNANSYDTASITPGANRLIIVAVLNNTNSNPPTVPTISGNGLTYVQIATISFDPISAPIRSLTLFRAMGASPSAGVITIDFAGATQLNCQWSVNEFAGVDTGGTNGSAAVVQSATNRADTGTSLIVTLAAFASVNNATYGAFAVNLFSSATMTEGSGFTKIGDFSATGLETGHGADEWRADNDTSVDMSGWATTDNAGIAIEIAAAAGGTAVKDLIGGGIIPFAR